MVDADSSLSGVVKIREGTLASAGFVFSECDNITSIHVPSSMRGLSDQCFDGCKSLETVTGMENVEYIGVMAFYNTKIESLNQNAPFYLNNCLIGKNGEEDNFVVADGTRVIASYAIGSTKTLTIPASVRYINDCAVSYCDSLETVTVLATQPPKIEKYSFSIVTTKPELSTATFVVPKGTLALYQSTEYWKDLNLVEASV